MECCLDQLSRSSIDKAGKRLRKLAYAPHEIHRREADLEIVRAYRRFRALGLPWLFRSIRRTVAELPCHVSVRAKRTDAIVRKLSRIGTIKLTRMDDVVAARILCASVGAQKKTIVNLARCHSEFGTVRIKQYIDSPRPDGYRAAHLIVYFPQTQTNATNTVNYSVEIQIRTYFQHIWATMSESFGEQVKQGGGTKAERDYLAELSHKIGSFENESQDYIQKGIENRFNGLCFQIVSFKKKPGTVRDSTEFHENEIESALSYLSMLERLESDQAVEVVLLGASCKTDTLHTTHERYYRARGIPALPDYLKPSKNRPERITRPFG